MMSDQLVEYFYDLTEGMSWWEIADWLATDPVLGTAFVQKFGDIDEYLRLMTDGQ